MDRAEVISEAKELKETCRQAQRVSQRFYEEMLGEYAVHTWALKLIGDPYPWDEVIDLQEQHNGIRCRLPNVTDEEFNHYVFLGDLLAVLLEQGS